MIFTINLISRGFNLQDHCAHVIWPMQSIFINCIFATTHTHLLGDQEKSTDHSRWKWTYFSSTILFLQSTDCATWKVSLWWKRTEMDWNCPCKNVNWHFIFVHSWNVLMCIDEKHGSFCFIHRLCSLDKNGWFFGCESASKRSSEGSKLMEIDGLNWLSWSTVCFNMVHVSFVSWSLYLTTEHGTLIHG